MGRTLSATLSPKDLPLAELCAMRLDGEVRTVDECFSPVDEPDRQLLRAEAFCTVIPPCFIAEQHSALWLYGIQVDAPNFHQVCVAVGNSFRARHVARAKVREVTIAEEEIHTIGTVRLTTILRTALDLARWSELPHNKVNEIILRLSARENISYADCLASLEKSRNTPHKKRALNRLADALKH